MLRKAIVAVWSACTLMAPAAVCAAESDIVFYATDGSNLHGNWVRQPDPTAAGGQVVASVDRGWANTVTPLASPADFVDFTFSASSGIPYRLWMRLRAAGNSRNNDSVYVQFSDAAGPGGASVYAIGTADGITINLAGDSIGNGLNGWGWRDGAYWTTPTPALVFASSGGHTLRVQTREDGVAIDQIVLSPVTYLNAAPGGTAADATIVPRPSTIPVGWASQLVGTGAGDSSLSGSTFTLTNAGQDIWGTADAFQFVWRTFSGDARIVARVASLQSTQTFAKAGVMFRDTAAPGSAHVLLDMRPNGAIEFMTRTATGGVTAYIAGGVQPAPAWLRLTRIGSTYTGEISPDGIAWTVVGSTSAPLASSASAGLVVTSHDVTRIATGVFDSVSVTVAPSIPTGPTPAQSTANIPIGAPMTWSAPEATSYDVRFGANNDPAPAAAGLTAAIFSPPAMQNGTTYYWQVTARNAFGTAVGPVWSFTTEAAPLPQPPAAYGYNAISDRNPYTKPPLPALGAAGFAFSDPTFGSAMLRVTDAFTRPGLVNRSFRVPSNAHLSAWNATSTMFYVISTDGAAIPYTFDAAAMTASRIQPVSQGNGGLQLAFYGEPQFSLVNPSVIYGTARGGNNRTIAQYDFQTGLYSTLVNLDAIVPGLTGYVGGLMSGGVPSEALLTFFGGGGQDAHYYALWAPVGNMGGRKLLNTLASTINGMATSTPLNFRLHSAQIDRSGRFVLLYPTSVDLGAPRYASKVYVWDTATDVVTAVTSGGKDGGPGMHPSGHDATGYGYWINQDCCTSSTWDAGQWQFRRLDALSQTIDIIAPALTPKEVYLADHTSWNNAQPGALMPVISSTYRYGNNTAPWRAWDDEIIGIETAAGGGATVWRFAHHRSLVGSDTNPAVPYFWYEPIANVSPDGKWVVFTSNWEKTLGTDPGAGTFREDVFLVRLTQRP